MNKLALKGSDCKPRDKKKKQTAYQRELYRHLGQQTLKHRQANDAKNRKTGGMSCHNKELYHLQIYKLP